MSMNTRDLAADTAKESPKRLTGIDVLRGIALLAMASYHFTWDLRLFDLSDIDPLATPALVWYSHAVAASFLALVGVSLTLAHRGGLHLRPWSRRLAIIGAAAALVTVTTRYAFPESYIFFGILHHIALASILALPFLRWPLWASVMGAAFAFAAPSVLTSPFFDHVLWLWLGLSPTVPPTNDYVPLLPWFGCVLTGVVLGRLVVQSDDAKRVLSRGNGFAPTRLLGAMGRHSLAFYLIHQPVLLGLLWLGLQSGVIMAAPDMDFRTACDQSCRASGENPQMCHRVCGCIADRLKGSEILASRRGPLSGKEEADLGKTVAACRRENP